MRKLVFIIFTTVLFCSCNQFIARLYGYKKPKPESNTAVIHYLENKNIDYDYLFRPNELKDYNKVTKALKHSNGISLLDTSFNLLSIEDSSICHMGVRGTTLKLLRDPTLQKLIQSKGNIKSIFDSSLFLINSKKNHQWNNFKNKRLSIVLSVNIFSGVNEKMSDVDFIEELKHKNLRDSVNIIIVNGDLPANKLTNHEETK